MTYATLLLPLDDDENAGFRLDMAAKLARRFEGRLVGLSCHRPALVDADLTNVLGIDPLTIELSQARALARDRERTFEDSCRAAKLSSFHTLVDDDEPSRALIHRSHCSDLLILGQPDPADPRHAVRREVLEQALLHGARPTLVFPYAGQREELGDTVLIAWNDTREAACAASDALPWLRRARSVHIVQFLSSWTTGEPIDQSGIEPVVDWLAGHGVTAKARVTCTETDVGNTLLSYAADIGADLLVMGSWGKSRWAERVLGGTTRTVLECMTVPVLMSH
jgi:nucleotide-binding universal stress UspA family protein